MSDAFKRNDISSVVEFKERSAQEESAIEKLASMLCLRYCTMYAKEKDNIVYTLIKDKPEKYYYDKEEFMKLSPTTN
jgi:hypothetical protein